jgi:hypothetical protein
MDGEDPLKTGMNTRRFVDSQNGYHFTFQMHNYMKESNLILKEWLRTELNT